jgi:hypothetical protein
VTRESHSESDSTKDEHGSILLTIALTSVLVYSLKKFPFSEKQGIPKGA